jgi:hypothetical protein
VCRTVSGFDDLVERAAHGREPLAADVQVAGRGREVRVAEQHLQGQQIRAVFEQVGCKAVAQAVDAAAIGKPRALQGTVEDFLGGAGNHRNVPAAPGGEEPGDGAFEPVIGPQFLYQPGTEDRVAILAPLALLDAQHHAGALNVVYLQVTGFVEPQARPVNCHQKRPMPEMAAAFQKKLLQLLACVNSRPPGDPAPAWQNLLECVHRTLEHLPVEKPQRADRHIDRAKGQPSLTERNQIALDLLVAEPVG